MPETITEVIRHFAAGRVGFDSYGNLSSKWDQNKKVLLSYEAVIAAWGFNGDESEIIIFEEWDGFSPTTTRHISELERQLEEYDVEYSYSTETFEDWR